MILYCMDNSYDQIIPKVGLGTYNMDSKESEFMTYEAIKYGYRHIAVSYTHLTLPTKQAV